MNTMQFLKVRKKPVQVWAAELPVDVDIPTLEGVHHAKKGNFLIIGIKGELYSCDPEIFAETYNIIEGPQIKKQRRKQILVKDFEKTRKHKKHKKISKEKECLICKNDFIPKSNRQETCSIECRKIKYEQDNEYMRKASK